jgi:hypothetical protein
MRIGNFQSHNTHAATIAIERFFYCLCHRFGKEDHFRQEFIGQVKKIIDLNFRHHQNMTSNQWENVEEGEEFIILNNFVRRDFASNYF